MDQEQCRRLDAADPLAGCRAAFELPPGVIYLDGNSLGPLSKSARRRLDLALGQEWGQGLILGWTESGWLEAPQRVGDRIGSLIGAAPGQVVVSDNTTVNLYKLASPALTLRPDRSEVLIQDDDFPTDRFVAAGLAAAAGGRVQVRHFKPDDMAGSLDAGTALVILSQVDYRTGRLHDMPGITRTIHDAGALVLWDLSHSAGAVPVALDSSDVDLAAGCTYKFLNGGPGSPAYCYVAQRLQSQVRSPIWSWLGHAEPFAFGPSYEPGLGPKTFITGTPGILGLAALEGALEAWRGVDLALLRQKSLDLADTFIALVKARCAGAGLDLLTPRERDRRGSQVSWRHPRAQQIIAELIRRGVIGDFRPPDICRFGLTPLYLGFEDVWHAVDQLRTVLESFAAGEPTTAVVPATP
ncbi:MAG: kynureninase [Candidatus Dormibacter sp.]|uniref:kynureninase n=1 Tax=Candidatus Dormibacter sp. TaxID=2973982 RepID=UPI000DB24BE0|nr:MAG: kynureninase [Candidatus Dormibacteraeota bacterium]